ncbi:hypothetical protein H1C71_018510, partial [Ictidomys tridecemlineatus]
DWAPGFQQRPRELSRAGQDSLPGRRTRPGTGGRGCGGRCSHRRGTPSTSPSSRACRKSDLQGQLRSSALGFANPMDPLLTTLHLDAAPAVPRKFPRCPFQSVGGFLCAA